MKVLDLRYFHLGLLLDREGVFLVIVDVDACFPRASSHAVLEENVWRIEVVDVPESLAHLAQRDTSAPIHLESANKKPVHLLRDWQNGGKEVSWVPEIGLERTIVGRR